MAFEQDVEQFISDLFDFHGVNDAPDPKLRADTHEAVRTLFRGTARAIVAFLPQPTPERNLALRGLANVMREVNYAVSIGQSGSADDIGAALDKALENL